MSEITEDLAVIVAKEGPLKLNHMTGSGHIKHCVQSFIVDRLKPETIAAVNRSPDFYQLCLHAYMERARYEANHFPKNNPNNRKTVE